VYLATTLIDNTCFHEHIRASLKSVTMSLAPALREFETVSDGPRAAALMQHPVRRSILELARTPMSSTEMAGRLGLPRQRVNYHVRQLERARFLSRAERRLRRNMMEQRYVATARSYVIAPELLGALAPHASAVRDAASAAALFAIASRAQDDMIRVVADAEAQSKRVATLSLTADVRFESAEQRAAFTAALERAIVDIVAEHSLPYTRADGAPPTGRPYRLFLGCHPIPRPEGDGNAEPSPEADSDAAPGRSPDAAPTA
jgi:predicted ArsR family transcriptional regulator